MIFNDLRLYTLSSLTEMITISDLLNTAHNLSINIFLNNHVVV